MSSLWACLIMQALNLCTAKAVYYPDPETGALTLARVHQFDKPIYTEYDGSKPPKKARAVADQNDIENDIDDVGEEAMAGEPDPANVRRAARRARRLAFDLIMCNPCLDTFVTLTYDPEKVVDRADHADVYGYLKTWLSNSVQRRDMRYVCVPERHIKGGIHWHMICNHAAVPLERARSAHSGRVMSRHGDPLYNVTNWSRGFSTAQLIRQRHDGEDQRAAVAKYMFKYMTKNFGAKVGGRYMLHGGALVRPVEVYGMGVEEFGDPTSANLWEKEVMKGETNLVYREYDFLHGLVKADQ